MVMVPRYDQPTVDSNTLPSVQVQAPVAKNFAIEEGQQAMAGVQKFGDATQRIAMDMQNQANALRVDEATNQFKEASLRLTFDKDVGFLSVKGEKAVAIADRYGDELKGHITKIGASLGNDAQRQVFSARANDMLTSFRGQAMQHEAEQGKVWADETDSSSIKLKLGEVGINFNNPAKVEQLINGGKDEQGYEIKGIKQHVEAIAKRTGKPPEWVDEKTRELVAGAHKEIITRMMDESPTKAQAYLNDNKEAVGDHVTTLQRSLKVAVDREQGNLRGEKIFADSAPFGSTFDSIANRVLKIEGGYVADDAGRGETNLGINKTANPDVDIKGLTPEKAKALYKERYWNAIGADSLQPEMRAVAFDAAVNHGPSKANKMLAESGGDPAKFIELRKAEYARLIAADTEKYGKYEKSWNSRLNQLSASLKGERSKSAMLEEANSIDDPEQRSIALSRVSHLAESERLAKKEEYDNNLNAAQEVAFAKPGGWSDISPTSWSQLKPEDREKLRAGLPKQSDPNTKLMLQQDPDLWKAGSIEKYRSLLSESDYQHFYNNANGPQAEQKILQAKIDNEQFSAGMLSAGMEKVLNAKTGTPEWETRVELKAKYETMIEAEQQAKGKTLTIDEKNALLTRMLKPVIVGKVRTDSWFVWRNGPYTEEARAYQAKSPRDIQIPRASREAITADFEKRGIKATPDRILNAYLASKETQ